MFTCIVYFWIVIQLNYLIIIISFEYIKASLKHVSTMKFFFHKEDSIKYVKILK